MSERIVTADPLQPRIEFVPANDPRVSAFMNVVPWKTKIWLFDNFWGDVEHVALAVVEAQDVGIATLSPNQGDKTPVPDLIAVWVLPALRQRRIANKLVLAMSERSQAVYGKLPMVTPLSDAGNKLCLRALACGLVSAVKPLDQNPIELR